MYLFRVMFKTGSTKTVRAESPKQAYERASGLGVITWIKWIRS